MSNALGAGLVPHRPEATGGRLLARATAALGVAVVALVAVFGTPSVAGAVTAGTEVLVTPGTSRALASGGSTTPYGVVLPTAAACPGDTAHQGYLVYSYLVPRGASPTDVSFRTGVPSKWYGYIAGGAYYGAVNTAESTGQIVGLPTSFVWSRLTRQDLFPSGTRTATWNGGIACTNAHGQVTDYWNSTIEFTASAADPHGFTWKAVNQGAVPSSIPVGLWAGVALLVVAAGAGAYALRLRRRGDSSGAGPDGLAPIRTGRGTSDGDGSPSASDVSHGSDVPRGEALSR